jgi:hypothetical protein
MCEPSIDASWKIVSFSSRCSSRCQTWISHILSSRSWAVSNRSRRYRLRRIRVFVFGDNIRVKRFSRQPLELGGNDAPWNWLQHVLKIEYHTIFLTAAGLRQRPSHLRTRSRPSTSRPSDAPHGFNY